MAAPSRLVTSQRRAGSSSRGGRKGVEALPAMAAATAPGAAGPGMAAGAGPGPGMAAGGGGGAAAPAGGGGAAAKSGEERLKEMEAEMAL